MSQTFENEKTIEIQLVRPTEVCGKVLSVKNGYKSVKTALLLFSVIDADHQNSCLFTNKGRFLSPLWVLIGDIAKFHVDQYDHCAACCFPLYSSRVRHHTYIFGE